MLLKEKRVTNEDVVIYTQEQKDFIQKMLQEIPEVQKYLEENADIWGDDTSFLIDLYPFVELVKDSIINGNNKLSIKVLNKIEEFLEGSDDETKGAITYFFFETLTNGLGWRDKKYMKIFISMLGPNSKDCCREVDKFWKTKTPGLYDD